MQTKSVLIVEDEVLIANQMKNWLKKSYTINVDISIDYNSAILNLKSKHYDLVLLDVQISSNETGIDLAKWINKNLNIPFIFLTSYADDETLNEIKSLGPIGFINKPIREINFAMMINLHLDKEIKSTFKFETKTKTYTFDLNKILYIQSEHIYLKLHFTNNSIQLIRCSLTKFLEIVPDGYLLQVNRSVAVNNSFITEKSSNRIIVGNQIFPISPNFKSFFESF